MQRNPQTALRGASAQALATDGASVWEATASSESCQKFEEPNGVMTLAGAQHYVTVAGDAQCCQPDLAGFWGTTHYTKHYFRAQVKQGSTFGRLKVSTIGGKAPVQDAA